MSIGGTVYYKRQDIGCLLATGRDRLDLLHRLSTNDLLSLTPGTGTITVLTSDKGRIVDLLTVYCFADHLLLLCSSGNQDTVLRYLDKYTITEDFTINDISAKFKIYSILGDNAKNT
jgi:aminomethyltransferase